MPFSLPSTFFHSLLHCVISAELNVQSFLDAGKVVNPMEAYGYPHWFLSVRYVLEIGMFFRCLCYMQLKNGV